MIIAVMSAIQAIAYRSLKKSELQWAIIIANLISKIRSSMYETFHISLHNNYCSFRNLVKSAHFKGGQFKL